VGDGFFRLALNAAQTGAENVPVTLCAVLGSGLPLPLSSSSVKSKDPAYKESVTVSNVIEPLTASLAYWPT